MKKIFTLFSLALLCLAASAQEPLYTVTTTLDNDPEWGRMYAPYFAFCGTQVTIDVYADDYLVIRNWAGAEGCDLRVDYDPTVDVDADECLGNILAVTAYINGVMQKPLSYQKTVEDESTGESYTYTYFDFATGRGDYAVASSTLNDDGSLYWSFVEVDHENKTGYVALNYINFMTADYSAYMDETYYFAAWPYVENDVKPIYGTFKGEAIEYTDDEGNPSDYYGKCYLKGYRDVEVEVLGDHAIIHDWSHNPASPRDIKVYCDDDDNVTALYYINGDKETEITDDGGYIYTGYTSTEENYLYDVYVYRSYCLGGWDNDGGYVMLRGYPYTRNVESKTYETGEFGYCMISWPQTEEGEDDAVARINARRADATLYNLAGQRVSNAARGIFIRGGKKIVK